MTVLRSLRSLPPVAWSVLLLTIGNSAGTGLVLPLLVLYMHSVRHLEYSVATGVIVAASIGAAIGAPIVGALSDRIGRLPAIAGSMVVAGIGSLGYAITDTAWKALFFGLVQGLGLGGAAIMNALIADVVPAKLWATVYGLNFAIINGMIGVGGLIGGFIVGSSRSVPIYQILFVCDAASWFITALLLVMLFRSRVRGQAAPEGRKKASGTRLDYGAVLRDGRMVRLLLILIVLYIAAYSQLTTGMPGFILELTRLRGTQLGIMFGVDTFGVVAIQFMLVSTMKKVHPKTALVLLSLSWAAWWGLLLLASVPGSELISLLIMVPAMAVFAFGEGLLANTGPTLINSWAATDERGRYNAAFSVAQAFGFTMGPLISGILLAHGGAVMLAAGGAVCCLVIAGVVASGEFLPRVALSDIGTVVKSDEQGSSSLPDFDATVPEAPNSSDTADIIEATDG